MCCVWFVLIAQARFLSDTTHRPMVTSESVIRQCLIVSYLKTHKGWLVRFLTDYPAGFFFFFFDKGSSDTRHVFVVTSILACGDVPFPCFDMGFTHRQQEKPEVWHYYNQGKLLLMDKCSVDGFVRVCRTEETRKHSVHIAHLRIACPKIHNLGFISNQFLDCIVHKFASTSCRASFFCGKLLPRNQWKTDEICETENANNCSVLVFCNRRRNLCPRV